MKIKNLDDYYPGQGCNCNARSERECDCEADWTPKEVYVLRNKVERQKKLIVKLRNEIDYINETNGHLCDALS